MGRTKQRSLPGVKLGFRHALIAGLAALLIAMLSPVLKAGRSRTAPASGDPSATLAVLNRAYPVNSAEHTGALAHNFIVQAIDGSYSPLDRGYGAEEFAAQFMPRPNLLRDPNLNLGVRFPARFAQATEIRCTGVGAYVRPLDANERSFGAVSQDGALIYADAFENCDVAYRCSAATIEEYLCLRSADSGAAHWTWDIDLHSSGVLLHPRLNPNGVIEMLDPSGAARLRIDAPEGKDAHGRSLKYAQRLKYSLSDNGQGSLRLTLTADVHLLSFPIVIDPSWSATSTMVSPRAGHTGTLLVNNLMNNTNGLVLIAGGSSQAISPTATATCELYDPVAGTFTLTGSMNTPRQQHVATLLQDGRVLVVGGLDGNGNPLNTGEIFNPATALWTPLGTTMSAVRTLHSVSVLKDGRVLVIGGTSGTSVLTPLNAVDIFTPGADTFAPGPFMAVQRAFHTSTTLLTGKVVVVGGEDSSGNEINTAELFDPAANGNAGGWSFTLTTMSAGRYSHKAALLTDGTVLIAGGFNQGLFPSAETYDPGLNDFTPTGSMSRVRTEHRMAVLPNGKVLLSGCHDGSFANVEVYDATTTPTGSFQITGSMVQPHTRHTVTTMLDGRVLVAGGFVSAFLKTAEIYDPHSEPVAQSVTANGPTPLAISFQTNSIDDAPATFAVSTQPANGSLSGSGSSFVYTANPGYSGPDLFMFTSTDFFGVSKPAKITVTVNSLIPTIVATSPNASIAGSAGFSLIVNGTGFVTGSVVQFNGTNRPTAFVSTTQLTATIPASDVAVAGAQTITVVNPIPGGGASTPQAFNTMGGTLGLWIVTNTQDTGTGSLRFCMNNVRNGDMIVFDPNVFALVNSSAATVINVLSQLPALDKGNVTIDASNSRVTVNGSGAGSSFGLFITSSNNTVLGLSIVGFTKDGVCISGGNANVIGGSRALPATGAGPNAQGLRISGNGAFGIEINSGGSNNVIKGCWIGLDASGAAPQPNLAGILMQAGSSSNQIGSTVADEANFISGNLFEGVTVSDVGTNNNVVMGNIIGASAVTVASASVSAAGARDLSDLGGRSDVGNGAAGMFLSKGTNNTQVGGDPTMGQGNGIGFNGGNGVEVRASSSKQNSSKGNKISHNKGGKGIALFDGSNNGIQPPLFDIVYRTDVTTRDASGMASVHIAGHAAVDGTVEVFTDPESQGGDIGGRATCSAGQWQLDTKVDPTQNITATLTDNSGNTSSFSVFGPAPSTGAPSFTNSLTALGMINTPFSLQLTAGGAQPVTYGSSQLPAGLTLSGDTITGTPTASGTYMIHLTATNSSGSASATLILIINSNFTLDTDGDGVPDWLENLAGTDPKNPFDFPATADPISVDKVALKLGAGTAPDSLSTMIHMTLPPGFVATGTVVSIQVGNVIRTGFMLDSKGHAVKGPATVSVKPNTKGSNTMVIQLTIKNDKLKTDLAGDGFSDTTTASQGVLLSLPVGVSVSSLGKANVSSNSVSLIYKAKKGKGGSATRTK